MPSVEEQVSYYERRIEKIRTLWLKGEISDYDYERTVSIIEEKIDKLRKEPIQPAGEIFPRPNYEKKPPIKETKGLPNWSTTTMVMGGILMVIGFMILLYVFSVINQLQGSLEMEWYASAAIYAVIFVIVGFIVVIYGTTGRGEEKGRMVR